MQSLTALELGSGRVADSARVGDPGNLRPTGFLRMSRVLLEPMCLRQRSPLCGHCGAFRQARDGLPDAPAGCATRTSCASARASSRRGRGARRAAMGGGHGPQPADGPTRVCAEGREGGSGACPGQLRVTFGDVGGRGRRSPRPLRRVGGGGGGADRRGRAIGAVRGRQWRHCRGLAEVRGRLPEARSGESAGSWRSRLGFGRAMVLPARRLARKSSSADRGHTGSGIAESASSPKVELRISGRTLRVGSCRAGAAPPDSQSEGIQGPKKHTEANGCKRSKSAVFGVWLVDLPQAASMCDPCSVFVFAFLGLTSGNHRACFRKQHPQIVREALRAASREASGNTTRRLFAQSCAQMRHLLVRGSQLSANVGRENRDHDQRSL